jgi:hypothetical protein
MTYTQCRRCGDGVRADRFQVDALDRRTDATATDRQFTLCESCFYATVRFLAGVDVDTRGVVR